MTTTRSTRDPRPVAHRPTRRGRVFLICVCGALSVAFGALVVRMFEIQILGHTRFVAAKARYSSGEDPVPSRRGDIETADEVIVARSLHSWIVGIDPTRLATRDDVVRVVREVCETLELTDEERRDALRRAVDAQARARAFVRIARRIDEASRERIEAAVREGATGRKDSGALVFNASSHREYPNGNFLGPVVGTVDVDGRGVEGIERSMDSFLSHVDGRRRVVKDAWQKMRIYYPENSDVAPIHGFDVVLTIDSRAQKILEEELAEGMRKYRTESGMGVVMDCRSGDIIAMASTPSYDPALYSTYPEEVRSQRRKNRAIEDEYEPGSVLKPFIAAWALRHGLTHREEIVWEGGRTHRLLGRRTVTDVHDSGPLTLDKVVYKSSNIGMSILGLRLGGTRINEMLDTFGFGRPTGVSLPFESGGFRRPTSEWKELYTSVSVSFGYAVRVTPLQLCAAWNALVNGGRLYRPRLIQKLVREDTEILNPTVLLSEPISEDLSRQMREILTKVVEEEGTGRYLRLDGFRFGGKSGTADIGSGGRYTKKDYLASFEAFAPAEDPQIVIVVQMTKPRSTRYYGSWVSGPVVVQFLRRWFRIEDQPVLVDMGLDED